MESVRRFEIMWPWHLPATGAEDDSNWDSDDYQYNPSNDWADYYSSGAGWVSVVCDNSNFNAWKQRESWGLHRFSFSWWAIM